MSECVQNMQGKFYAGMEEGKPVWITKRLKQTKFDPVIAVQVERQLKELGYEVKRCAAQ